MSETIRFLGKKILCEQTNLSKLQWQRRYLVLTTKAGRDENRLGFGAKVLHRQASGMRYTNRLTQRVCLASKKKKD